MNHRAEKECCQVFIVYLWTVCLKYPFIHGAILHFQLTFGPLHMKQTKKKKHIYYVLQM